MCARGNITFTLLLLTAAVSISSRLRKEDAKLFSDLCVQLWAAVAMHPTFPSHLLTPEDKKRIRKSSLIVPIAPLHNSVSQCCRKRSLPYTHHENSVLLSRLFATSFFLLRIFFSLSHYYSKGKIKTNQSIIHAKLSRVKLTLNWANQQQFRSQIFSPPGPRSPCKNAIQCQSVIKMDVSNIMTTKTFPFEMHLSLWLEASKEIMNIRMRRRKTTELSEDWSSIKRVKRFSQRVQWGALENGLSWVQIPLGSFLCAASLLLCWPVGKLIDTTVHLRFALGGDWGHASGFIPFDVPWMASVLFC